MATPNQYKWPSTDNFGSALNDLYPDLSILDSQVIFTEKLDGQNLSRTFDVNSNSFIGFSSRNQVLAEDTLNGKKLDRIKRYDQPILNLIPNFDLANVEQFIVVGEYLPAQIDHKGGNITGVNLINYGTVEDDWVVFGLLFVNTEGNKTHRYLDKELYNLFVECGFRVPQILFEGILRDGILNSSSYMNQTIEGVVITSYSSDTQFNYKFKVGIYDERPRKSALIVDGKDFNDSDKQVVKYVEDMYFSTKVERKKKKKVDTTVSYAVSIASELSKRNINPEELAKDHKNIKPLASSIVEAINLELELDDLDKEVLSKQVSRAIGKIIGSFMALKKSKALSASLFN